MTALESGRTAVIGAAFLFVGITLVWYCEIAGIKQGPAHLFKAIGALLLMVGLYTSL